VQAMSGTNSNNLRFPGQYFQIETGFHTNHHRMYDPVTGRYTQPDPLRFVDGPSIYAYAKNSPLMYTDRDGYEVWATGGLNYEPPVGYSSGGKCVYGPVRPKYYNLVNDTFEMMSRVGMFGGMASVEVRLETQIAAKSNMLVNKAVGDAARDELAKLLTAAGREVRTEVPKWTPFGRRVIDIEVGPPHTPVGGIEVKTGDSVYKASQRAKDWWLTNVEGYIVNLVRYK
jgi:RHS repeat-associated protein